MPLFSRRLGAWIDPADVFVTLFSSDEYAFWLDRETHQKQRFSVMGHTDAGGVFEPSAVFEQLSGPFVTPAGGAMNVADAIESTDGNTSSADLPFAWRPGYVGWFDYQQDILQTGSISGTWLKASEAVVLDHDNRGIWLVGNFKDENAFTHWVNAALIRLGLSGGQRIGYLHRRGAKAAAKVTAMAHSPSEYLTLVQAAKQHIAAGDVYQLCLTNRLTLAHSADPLAVFLQLRNQNPAPYACYIRVGDRAIVSASPEQFLTVTSEGLAITRPIKGTRGRHDHPQRDDELARELADHPKERAENLMIVDLMRNDLGRVANPETVVVEELFEVEAHPTLHQLVSTVSARLRPEVSLAHLIEATFPAGSMTGAPKIKAMQLIDRMEQQPRGTYSGVAGYISSDGRLDLGMTIRTLVFEGDSVTLGVGGGITIDSDPSFEVAETALKAQALLRVLGADSPWL